MTPPRFELLEGKAAAELVGLSPVKLQIILELGESAVGKSYTNEQYQENSCSV